MNQTNQTIKPSPFTTRKMLLAAFCVALNVVLGSVVSWLSIPLLFMDTLGTIFSAAMLGPLVGSMVGIATNLLLGVTSSPTAIPFALVNVAIALVVGFMAKGGFTLPKAVITAVLVSAVPVLIGTPIRLVLFGGFTGSGTDVLILALRAAGQDIFSATFFSALAGNVVDKTISCLIAWVLVRNEAIRAYFR